jgi:hypothetical protein
MAVKLNIIGWRHSSKAAFRRYIDNLVAVQAFAGADAEEDKEEASSNKDKLWDKQTGHTSVVAGSIYRRPITKPVFSVEATQWEFCLASTEWHAFLQILSIMSKKPRKGTQAAAVRREAVKEEYCC